MADLLVVVRSGPTDYDLQGRIRGTLDIPLAPEGVSAAEAAARQLAACPPDVLYVSPSAPAVQTSEVIAGVLGLAPRCVAELGDLDLGLWQGMLVSEIRRRQPRLARHWEEDPWTVVPPEGEPLADARLRIATAVDRLVARHPAGRIALVVPRPLDRIVHLSISGASAGDLWEVGEDGPAIREMRLPQPLPRPTVASGSAAGLGAWAAALASFVPFRGRFGLAEP